MPDINLKKTTTQRYLTFAEREEISLLKAKGEGVREIARQIGRAASTVSRELRRNAATRSGYVEYRALTAHWHAHRRAKRPKEAKLVINAALAFGKQIQNTEISPASVCPGSPRRTTKKAFRASHGTTRELDRKTPWTSSRSALG